MCTWCRRGVLDTSGLLGSSVLDSAAWPTNRQHARTRSPSLAPSLLTTGATCKLPSLPAHPDVLLVVSIPC